MIFRALFLRVCNERACNVDLKAFVVALPVEIYFLSIAERNVRYAWSQNAFTYDRNIYVWVLKLYSGQSKNAVVHFSHHQSIDLSDQSRK